MSDIFVNRRKSYMDIGEIFFFTATINSWMHLLAKDQYKQVILDSLENLNGRKLADVFAFVIMPNHIHMIWKTLSLNGKETVQGSFLKYTAHCFRRMLINDDPAELRKYSVVAKNKQFEFWQRDSLAIHLYSKEVALQKLKYLHLNPLAERWQLAKEPSDYYWSSASFYDWGASPFGFLSDLRNEF